MLGQPFVIETTGCDGLRAADIAGWSYDVCWMMTSRHVTPRLTDRPSANGYLAIAAGGADAFRVYGPEGGDPCGTRVETHVSAKGNKCR